MTLFAALVSNNPYANFDAKALAIFLNSHSLRRKPGETFEYSNLGGGLLGFALANQAETTYENLIIGRITQPLGMLSTKITLTAKDQVRLASPHLAGGGKAAYWTFDSMAGAGALRSSAKDMLTFVQANLLPEATPLVAALTTTHKPQHATSAPKTRVGLGWMITESPTGTLIWHNGGTGGFSSFIGFDPDRKLGVVVLANSAAGVDPLAYDIWNVLTEPPPKSSEAK